MVRSLSLILWPKIAVSTLTNHQVNNQGFILTWYVPLCASFQQPAYSMNVGIGGRWKQVISHHLLAYKLKMHDALLLWHHFSLRYVQLRHKGNFLFQYKMDIILVMHNRICNQLQEQEALTRSCCLGLIVRRICHLHRFFFGCWCTFNHTSCSVRDDFWRVIFGILHSCSNSFTSCGQKMLLMQQMAKMFL